MKLFLIGAALAAAATPVAAQQRQQAQVRMNLSPAGQVVAKRYLGTQPPETKAFAARAAEIQRRQRALIAAPKLDMVQFAALLRSQEQLQNQVMRLGNERMLRLLRELSEADRVAFLRGLSNPTLVPAPAPK